MKLKLWMALSNHSAVCIGEDGRFYQVFRLEGASKASNGPLGSMPCQELCGNTLQRTHITCLTCRARKVWLGQLPKVIHIGTYILTWREGRRFQAVKQPILKKLLTIAEFLAN